jgi:hypothetical protein
MPSAEAALLGQFDDTFGEGNLLVRKRSARNQQAYTLRRALEDGPAWFKLRGKGNGHVGCRHIRS